MDRFLSPPPGAAAHRPGRLAGLILAAVISGVLLGVLPACSPGGERPVFIFGSPDSPRLREAAAGVSAGLAPRRVEVVTVPELGPEGDRTLKTLRDRHPALLVVLGSPALLRVAPAEKRTPVVFAMVANPYALGVAEDPLDPHLHQKNVTGVASPPPVGAALEQGARLFGPLPWGLLYDPAEGMAVEVAQMFTTLAPLHGLKPLTETSTDAAGDLPALRRLLARGARVLYLPPTATAARYAPLVLAWGRERRVRVVNSQPEIDPKGAVLSVTLDYRAIGEEAAALARRVLAGEKPEHLPLQEKTPLKIVADESLLRYWSAYPAPGR